MYYIIRDTFDAVATHRIGLFYRQTERQKEERREEVARINRDGHDFLAKKQF